MECEGSGLLIVSTTDIGRNVSMSGIRGGAVYKCGLTEVPSCV